MDNSKISVVINTYNAEKHLARVLESVKDFDEIVICDMESTDSTLDIARKYGCKIVNFERRDCKIVEPARQFAIQSATYKWVLLVDADELITTELHDYLYNRIKEEDCPTGLFIPRKNYFMGKFMICNYPDYILRFFERDAITWPPFVHAIPTVQGRTEKIPAKRKDLAFIHLANDSIKDRLAKTNQYTDNEVEKKKGKNYSAWALIYRPMFRFFKSYILKQGFRMGVQGFIYACFEGIYQFIVVCKILERRYAKFKASSSENRGAEIAKCEEI